MVRPVVRQARCEVAKGSNYEGGNRVPAIAWWPSRIEPGQQTDALAISLDVMPTLLSIAGYDSPSDLAMDRSDLSPVLFGNQPQQNRRLFWNGRAMRDGNLKLVLERANPESAQLFNLSQDLREKFDLSNRYPDRVASMLAKIAQWKQDVATGATDQPVKY